MGCDGWALDAGHSAGPLKGKAREGSAGEEGVDFDDEELRCLGLGILLRVQMDNRAEY